jgi:hypothetical protein
LKAFLGARLVKLQPRRKSRKCRCKKNKFEDEKFVQLERNECTKKMTKFLDSLDLFFPLSLSFLISSFVSWKNVKNGSLGMKIKKHKAKWVFERE